ncbi:hypothetical protein Ancab_027925 [Ancistrocladus abbreviatus]
MHELGVGTTGNNPNYGTTRNPHALNRYTGGSSSGPAAIVASGLCAAALGTDGGGSVRIPSPLCGVVGLKSTYGQTDMTGYLQYPDVAFEFCPKSYPSVSEVALKFEQCRRIVTFIVLLNEQDYNRGRFKLNLYHCNSGIAGSTQLRIDLTKLHIVRSSADAGTVETIGPIASTVEDVMLVQANSA